MANMAGRITTYGIKVDLSVLKKLYSIEQWLWFVPQHAWIWTIDKNHMAVITDYDKCVEHITLTS